MYGLNTIYVVLFRPAEEEAQKMMSCGGSQAEGSPLMSVILWAVARQGKVEEAEELLGSPRWMGCCFC